MRELQFFLFPPCFRDAFIREVDPPPIALPCMRPSPRLVRLSLNTPSSLQKCKLSLIPADEAACRRSNVPITFLGHASDLYSNTAFFPKNSRRGPSVLPPFAPKQVRVIVLFFTAYGGAQRCKIFFFFPGGFLLDFRAGHRRETYPPTSVSCASPIFFRYHTSTPPSHFEELCAFFIPLVNRAKDSPVLQHGWCFSPKY